MIADSVDPRTQELLNLFGYTSLYPPQQEALEAGLFEKKNLLITTPTASGKTLIAIMATLKSLDEGKKVVYLTPLRALTSEKYYEMLILEKINFARKIKISIASSDYDASGNDMASSDVIILTNEKLDSIIRHGAGWLSEVGLFVIDEVHLIGDKERGPTLEIMLTKIKAFYPDAQILALSATITNSSEITSWLECELVQSKWRPTVLIEGVYDYGSIKLNNGDYRKLEKLSGVSAAVDVAIDGLANGGQSLIFAETRKRAASLAARASDIVYKSLDNHTKEKAQKASAEILQKGDDTEITRTLAGLVLKGTAFHHAGLGPHVREIVEQSFKSGIIKILAATPTLAAGVNLPARRVVLASILRYDFEYGGNMPISIMEYKQLCGRAGRPKYDKAGEAIIIATESASDADNIFEHYIQGIPEPIRSQMSSDKAIRTHLLGTISSVAGIKKSEITSLFESTLFARQYRKVTVNFKVDTALEYLEANELIRSRNSRYIATDFGKRTSLLYIDPLTAVDFKKALTLINRKTRQLEQIKLNENDKDSHVRDKKSDFNSNFKIETGFDILTRQNEQGNYREGLPDSIKEDNDITITSQSIIKNNERDRTYYSERSRQGHALGILHLIASCTDFYPKLSLRKKDIDHVNILIGQHYEELFYQIDEYDCSRSLLALYEWIEESGERQINEKLGVDPGDMYRMVEVSDWLLRSLYEISKVLGHESMLWEIQDLRTRVRYGIRSELLQIVSLEGVGRVRARSLYNAGYTTIQSIAKSSEAKLAIVPKIGPALAKKLKEQLKKKE